MSIGFGSSYNEISLSELSLGEEIDKLKKELKHSYPEDTVFKLIKLAYRLEHGHATVEQIHGDMPKITIKQWWNKNKKK